jgi:phosphoglycolate phosphatase
MQYKAIFIDLDGTLIDSIPLYTQANMAVLKNHGVDLREEDFAALQRQGMHVLDEWVLRTGYDEATRLTVHAEIMEACSRMLKTHVRWQPDAQAFLAHLKKHTPHAIVTSASKIHIDAVHDAIGLYDHIDVSVHGDDTVGRYKPDPYPLLLAAERMGVDPTHCLYIGDLHTDIDAARAAGMQSCLVTRPHTPSGKHTADHAVEELSAMLRLL